MSQNNSHLALSDNGFLFDTITGLSFTLNRVGTVVLKELIAGKDAETISDKLVDIFEVSFDTALNDTEQFIDIVKGLGLVKG